MFRVIASFELKYWLTRPVFYVYATVFFLLAMGTMAGSAGVFGEGSSNAFSIANAPFNLFSDLAFLQKLLLFLLPTLVGVAIYRDFGSNMHSLLYAYPFTKRDYLLGKFVGSFLLVMMIGLATELGLLAGTLLPGVNPAQVVSLRLSAYWFLFYMYLLPNLFIMGVIVFWVVTFSRNIYTGYLTVLAVLMLREVLNRIFQGGDVGNPGQWLDPFGETAMYYFTQFWTPLEKNTQPLPAEPIILYNRLLWLGLSVGLFAVGYRWFSFSQHAFQWGWKKRGTPVALYKKEGSVQHIDLPPTTFDYSWVHQLKTAWRLSQTDFRYILRSGGFLIITAIGTLFNLVLMLQMNPLSETKTLPVTWLILGFPILIFSMFITGLTFLYSGFLVQRAKAARMNDLINTTPAPNWVLLLSQLLAMIKVQLALLSLLMITGIGVQVYNGYYYFEIDQYLSSLFGIHLIGLVIWALAAFWVHTIVGSPYLGLFVLLLGAMGILYLSELGVQQYLLKFNQTPNTGFYLKYSDLNGYGHDLISYLLYKTYWLLGGIFLFFATLLFWQRLRTETFVERLRMAWVRTKDRLAYALAISLAVFIGMGFFIYQQGKKTQAFPSGTEAEMRTGFNKKFDAYRDIPQPRVTEVFIALDLSPEMRSFTAKGHCILINKNAGPVNTLLVRTGFDEITHLRMEPSFAKTTVDSTYKFGIYELQNPMLPGDSLKLYFEIKNTPNFLLLQNSNVLKNGTYLKSDILPKIGYLESGEKALPTDTAALYNHYQSRDADLVAFEAVISTIKSQTAVAPGNLVKTWTKDGRRYFHYKTARDIKPVFGFNSGRFEVKRASFQNTDLRIYYHPTHTYCLDGLMDGLKASLAYNTQHFGPYPHDLAQVIEFSRSEGNYATTAGNCIPTSEMRFIVDNRKTEEGYHDLSFYVTAHELTHQWWGNQVIPADVLGAVMVTESVTEYLTAKIYEQKYGKALAEQFIGLQRRRYQLTRSVRSDTEPPLIYVDPDQSYISYGKGAFAFYTLSEYIGEANLDTALKAYFNKVKNQGPPYTTSLELVSYLKKATPDSLQYLVKDMFETVTFYENSLQNVQKTKLADGKYQLEIEAEIKKYRQGGLGQKTYLDDFKDYIEIGLYGKGDQTQSFYCKQWKLSNGTNKITIVTDQEPAAVELDPHARLMDAAGFKNKMVLR